MNRQWRRTLVYALLFGIIAVGSWSGFLGFCWYQASSLGRLVGNEAALSDPGRANREETQRRQAQIDEQINRLTPWQREIALATAVEFWGARPRKLFGSSYLWSLLFQRDICELMRRMVEAPIPDPFPAMPNSDRVVASLEWLRQISSLPLYLAGPDRTVDPMSLSLSAGEPFSQSLSAFAAVNGFRWEIVDQVIALGTDAELNEFVHRAERRKERVTRCQYYVRSSKTILSELLSNMVVIEFVETPLNDTVTFLNDYLGVNVILCSPRHNEQTLAERGAIPITVHLNSVTVGQWLDCQLMPIGLDWDVIDELIMIGTAEELADFFRRSARSHERISRSLLSENPLIAQLGQKLDISVRFDFAHAPFRDVIGSFEDTGVNVLALGEMKDQSGNPRSFFMLNTASLSAALDCLADQYKSDWDVVREFVCLGGLNDFDRFRRRLSETDRALAKMSNAVSSFLNASLASACRVRDPEPGAKNVKIYGKRIKPGEYSPDKIAHHFTAVPPAEGSSEFDDVICSFPINALPVYRALDAVCECTSLRWEPTESGTIRVFE